MHEQPTWRDYATIFLVSCAIMVFQIAITRVLSVVVWYHFVFLSISLVMLGLGVPGVWLGYVRRPARWLSASLAAAGVLVPASVFALLRWGSNTHEWTVLSLIAMILPATLSLGSAVCILLLRARGASVSRMYGWDLLGAGLGALVVVPLLDWLPTPQLVAACGLLPLIGLCLYPGVSRAAAAALIVASLALLGSGELKISRTKSYDERVITPVFERWTPIARIAVFDDTFFAVPEVGGFLWGGGANTPAGAGSRQYWIEQDGSAGTPIPRFDGDLGAVEHLLFDVTTAGYQIRRPASVAIIGAGGGRDILSALLSGAEEIDAVELNQHTIDIVSQRFAEVSGDPYHQPGVRAFADEGRSFLTHVEGRYDLIQISLIDSFAASTAGAFALAENNLYTVEAFELYLDRLSDGGLLSTSRWTSELPRLILLARAALLDLEVKDPAEHLMLVRAGKVGTLLVSRRAFDDHDRAAMKRVCLERGFYCVYPLDDGRQPSAHDKLFVELIGGDDSDLLAVGLRTTPPVDDSPYFFQSISPFADPAGVSDEAKRLTGLPVNLESTRILYEAMYWCSTLALLLFFLPFGLRIRRSSAQGRSPSTWKRLALGSLYFGAIGAGFMFFETMLVQRFVLYLGHPSYAATVILTSLLLGMGMGATWAPRVGVYRLRRYGPVTVVWLVVLATMLAPLITATLGLPFGLRVALTCLVLMPSGATLGLFFPLGMLHFGDADKAWFWAINGAFGVVATVFSLALSMQFGFTLVGLVSAAVYALACAAMRPRLPVPTD